MTEWEYWVVTVHYGEERVIDDRGRTKKQTGWWVTFADAEPQSEQDFLDDAGSRGWELVGAVVAADMTGALESWYHPHHRLYFKRSKQET